MQMSSKLAIQLQLSLTSSASALSLLGLQICTIMPSFKELLNSQTVIKLSSITFEMTRKLKNRDQKWNLSFLRQGCWQANSHQEKTCVNIYSVCVCTCVYMSVHEQQCMCICIMMHMWRSNDNLRGQFSPSTFETGSFCLDFLLHTLGFWGLPTLYLSSHCRVTGVIGTHSIIGALTMGL